MSNGGRGGNGKLAKVKLVIPYYVGDQGQRPLPSADPFWMCRSILVDGAPYGGQILQAGQSVELSLDAVNIGWVPATAVCVFFYARPTTNFTSQNTTIIASVNLPLEPGMVTPSPSVQWDVPEGLPRHICLLAMVTAPQDPAPAGYDAVADRHFGQQNLHLATASAGKSIRVGFIMANHRATPVRSRLEVTQLIGRYAALQHVVHKEAPLCSAEEINLTRARLESERYGDSLDIELGGAEMLDVELTALVPRDARPGSTIILQVAQYEERRYPPVGGLGVVIRVT